MVRVVTDTGSHLSPDLRRQFNIEVVPLVLMFGTRTYHDEVDMSNEQFYQHLTHEKVHPTTSAPAPAEFIQVWRPLLDAGEEIVSIHLPSGLSATYSSAVNACSELESERGASVPITLVDSRWISMAMGFQAIQGSRAAALGGTREQVVSAMTALDDRLTLVFLLDTLEFLRRGGRIGKARAFLGAVFHVKPILEIANANIEPLERARSRKGGIRRLIELIGEPPATGGPRVGSGPLHVAVLHADALSEAMQLENDIRARYDVAEMLTTEIGPTIAVHTGPQAIGLAFYRE